MSLFEQLAKRAALLLGEPEGPVAEGAAPPGAPGGLRAGIVELLGQRGLEGLLADFKSKGLGEIFASWVSSGQNLPITADQVEHGLGRDAVEAVSARLGVPPEQATALLAKYLPRVIDGLTPHGTIEGEPAAP